MKGKKLSLVMLATLLFVGLMAIPVSAQPITSIDVVFTDTGTTTLTWVEDGKQKGDSFTIEVTAVDAVSFYAFQAGLEWNSSVLNCTAVAWGELGTLSGETLRTPTDPYTRVNNTAGNIYPPISETVAGAGNPVTASEILLFTATFKTLEFPYPNTTISLINTKVVNGGDWFPPDYDLNNGTFTFTPIANVGPTASFTKSPAPPYYAPDEAYITFTSTSTDPDGSVVSWDWTIQNETMDVIATDSGSVISYNFTEAQKYYVTLNATDDGKLPYYPALSDTETQEVDVYVRKASGIDVVTKKVWLGNTTLHRLRGEGPDAVGSAFMPGETVTLRTEVLYEQLPVIDVYVGFQVNYPAGPLFTSLNAKTNSSGHAEVSFRLPQAPLPPFGLYKVISTARVFEEDFVDNLEFYVGWIIEINSVNVTTDPIARNTQATIQLDITNYDSYDAYPAVLTVSLFDKLSQTVGSDSFATDIPAGGVGTSATYIVYVDIAGFAWPGPATAKANAYTDWPMLGGSAYCPEETDDFEITLT